MIIGPDGKVLHHGPHIHPKPVYYKRNGKGKIEEIPVIVTQPMVGATQVITPTSLPSDIGSTIDVSKNDLWSPWQGNIAPDSDTYQGQYGSCYYISTIDSIDGENPGYIRSQDVIQKLSNGLFQVNFRRNGLTSYIMNGIVSDHGCRVNPKTGACALLIFEKAYAYFRTGAGTYASINMGWPGNAMSDLGLKNIAIYPKTGLAALVAGLSGNNAIDACTFGVTSTLISAHCYRVINIYTQNGITYVLLRNPWGVDGAAPSGDPNDGFVTITWDQFVNDVSAVAQSTSYATDVRLASSIITPHTIPGLKLTNNNPTISNPWNGLTIGWQASNAAVISCKLDDQPIKPTSQASDNSWGFVSFSMVKNGTIVKSRSLTVTATSSDGGEISQSSMCNLV